MPKSPFTTCQHGCRSEKEAFTYRHERPGQVDERQHGDEHGRAREHEHLEVLLLRDPLVPEIERVGDQARRVVAPPHEEVGAARVRAALLAAVLEPALRRPRGRRGDGAGGRERVGQLLELVEHVDEVLEDRFHGQEAALE
jgi:hypothetical protein